VTISVGINDVWSRLGAPHDEEILAAYKQNVTKMIDMAQGAGIEVILLTPTIIVEDLDSEGNRRLAMYVEAEQQIAKEKKCTLVDLHRMFLTALHKKPAGGEPTWLTADGVHMKPLGYAIMAVGLLRGVGVSDAMLAAHAG
jgi:lysophospholipase L1-like esterase